MSSRLLLNLGLLVLASVLVLVVLLEPGIDDDDGIVHITNLSVDAVVRLEIVVADGEAIVLTRDQDQWHLESPIHTPANTMRVEALLRMVAAKSHSRFPVISDELVRYGLDQPHALLRAMESAADTGVMLEFGTSSPLDGRRYLRVGDTVHLVDDRNFDILQAGYPAFVSSRLLPEGMRPVRLELPEKVLEQDAGGRWEMTVVDSPASARDQRSMDSLNRLVDDWLHARALMIQRYRDDQGPLSVIRIEDGVSGQVLVFDVLEIDGDLVLGRRDLGVRYHLGAEQGRRLLNPADDDA